MRNHQQQHHQEKISAVSNGPQKLQGQECKSQLSLVIYQVYNSVVCPLTLKKSENGVEPVNEDQELAMERSL